MFFLVERLLANFRFKTFSSDYLTDDSQVQDNNVCTDPGPDPDPLIVLSVSLNDKVVPFYVRFSLNLALYFIESTTVPIRSLFENM